MANQQCIAEPCKGFAVYKRGELSGRWVFKDLQLLAAGLHFEFGSKFYSMAIVIF